MKRREQRIINLMSELNYENAMRQLSMLKYTQKRLGKISLSKVSVIETNDFYLLQTAASIIAVINKAESICYDVTRMLCGQTETRRRYIIKFCELYDIQTIYEYVNVKLY